ncbi:MAG: hypothetical protein QXR30_03805 [Candidatus Woesearchaeota archaeon]
MNQSSQFKFEKYIEHNHQELEITSESENIKKIFCSYLFPLSSGKEHEILPVEQKINILPVENFNDNFLNDFSKISKTNNNELNYFVLNSEDHLIIINNFYSLMKDLKRIENIEVIESEKLKKNFKPFKSKSKNIIQKLNFIVNEINKNDFDKIIEFIISFIINDNDIYHFVYYNKKDPDKSFNIIKYFYKKNNFSTNYKNSLRCNVHLFRRYKNFNFNYIEIKNILIKSNVNDSVVKMSNTEKITLRLYNLNIPINLNYFKSIELFEEKKGYTMKFSDLNEFNIGGKHIYMLEMKFNNNTNNNIDFLKFITKKDQDYSMISMYKKNNGNYDFDINSGYFEKNCTLNEINDGFIIKNKILGPSKINGVCKSNGEIDYNSKVYYYFFLDNKQYNVTEYCKIMEKILDEKEYLKFILRYM